MDNLKTKLVDALGLGFGIWLMGYIAGMVLFFLVPADLIGWILFVVFTPIALYIAYLRFGKRSEETAYYLMIAAAWTLIAIVLDYLFIVVALNSKGYYKLDVFVYYATTFLVPLLIGWKYGSGQRNKGE
jgi:hypothetical protein